MPSLPPRRAPAARQGEVFLELWTELAPHVATDRDLPTRLQRRLSGDRRFGGQDRRRYRELLYTTLRYLPWLAPRLAGPEPLDGVRAVAWLATELPVTHHFRAWWCADWPAVPPSLAARGAHLGEDPATLWPAWFAQHCPAAVVSPECEVLARRAPLWIRLRDKDPRRVLADFAERDWELRPSPAHQQAYRVMTEADLTQSDSWQEGAFEIQDLGSQLVLAGLPLPTGGHWLDACAGAGGKTLQLAALLGPSAQIDAWDPRSAALDELATRAARAGVNSVQILYTQPSPPAAYDGVLVDAPCSGSGTWRRAPHLKWCTPESAVLAAATVQANLVAQYSALVRPGGWLVYATCSLSRHENDAVAAAFAAAHPEFTPQGAPRTLLPSRHDTDGFFAAAWRRAR